MNGLGEMTALLGGFVASSFALVRYSLNQQRDMTNRFVNYLESALTRQELATAQIQPTLRELGEAVRDSATTIARLGERISSCPMHKEDK